MILDIIIALAIYEMTKLFFKAIWNLIDGLFYINHMERVRKEN